MSTSVSKPAASRVWFDADRMWVELKDGRQLAVPLAYFPRLLRATIEQRTRFEMSGGGTGIHWEELDEDISIQGLLEGRGDLTRGNRIETALSSSGEPQVSSEHSLCLLLKSKEGRSSWLYQDVLQSKSVQADVSRLAAFVASNFTKEERLLLVLHYFEELPISEVALVLDMSEANAQVKFRDVLLRLRRFVQSDDAANRKAG